MVHQNLHKEMMKSSHAHAHAHDHDHAPAPVVSAFALEQISANQQLFYLFSFDAINNSFYL